MRKRRTILLLVGFAIVVVVGLLVIGAFRSREPEYEGKKLSEWVDMYPSFGLPGDADLAARGVRAIGSNGIPFLLRWLKYEPSTLKDKVYRTLNKSARFVGLPFRPSDVRNQRRASGARAALLALGPEAYPALKELTHVMYDPKTTTSASYALSVLNEVVFTSKEWRAVPALKEMLNDPNPKIREFAAHGLRVIGSPVPKPIPAQSERPAR